MRVAILLNLGRAEQALALIGEMEEKVEGAEWNNISQPRRLYKAHGLALLGREGPGGAAAVLRDCPALPYDLAARGLPAAATDP